MRLALDIGLAGLALGIERVEFQVEIMIGGFARVDRAAKDLPLNFRHGCTFVRQGAAATGTPLLHRGNAIMATRWLILDVFSTIAASTQPKEAGAVPGRAGDVARAMVERLG